MENKSIFVLLGVLLLGSGLAMAIPTPANVTAQTFLPRWEAPTMAGTITTEGGNISIQNITAGGALTEKWAGLFGYLTAGGLYLTDNNTGTATALYSWGGNVNGSVVCLTSGTNFDWTTSVGGTGANVDTYWLFTGTDSDSGVNTVVEDADCNVTFSGVGLVNANTIDQGGSFDTCVLQDGSVAAKADMAFCVNANDAGTSYSGAAADYELMVPTEETVGPGPGETYYVYVEIV